MSKKMHTIETFPVLYGVEKNGKEKMWSAHVETNKDKSLAVAVIEFGQVEGKHQIVRREYTEGKNIGKSNETTPLQQCINETRKKWTDKKEKERFLEKKDLEEELKCENGSLSSCPQKKVFPMLANTFEFTKKKKNNIVFPCYVQPKLDGLRCIIYLSPDKKSVMYQSRTGNYFETMEHMSPELHKVFKITEDENAVLDGELYTMDIPFEELAGIIKKKKITQADEEKLKKVHYHIYDIVNDKQYKERHEMILGIKKKLKKPEYIEFVQTHMVKNEDECKTMFEEFVSNNFEGIMLRNIGGLYRENYRSNDLQKYKEFMESEFKIIDFKEGDGRDAGTVIWVCETPDEKREFSVRPKGTIEMRRELFNNAKKYIGKNLTVIYQELSELGVPRFPVGKSVRDGF
jgi:ATP-dependent DNA ligase